MRRTRDAKVDLLASTALCRGWSTTQVWALARLADVVDVPAGSVLRSGAGRSASSYLVLSGSLLVGDGAGLSFTPAGHWVHGRRGAALATTDVRALVFRPQDLREAVHLLPVRPS